MRVSRIRMAAAAALILSASLVGAGSASAQSVMSACAAEWKDAQASNATGGATWPQFLSGCKARHAQPSSASMAPAPAPTPMPAPAPAPQQPSSPFPWWQPNATSAPAAPAPTGAGQFRTEAEAKYRCPTDKVVWVNTKSNIYHYQGTHNYGHTKEGAYMCEADARAAGARGARTIIHSRHTG